MKHGKPQHLQMPPELVRCLGEHMNIADVLAAELGRVLIKSRLVTAT
jgi:hypothetical protein